MRLEQRVYKRGNPVQTSLLVVPAPDYHAAHALQLLCVRGDALGPLDELRGVVRWLALVGRCVDDDWPICEYVGSRYAETLETRLKTYEYMIEGSPY